MARVALSDTGREGPDEQIVAGVGIVIVAMHPEDVVVAGIALTEEAAVVEGRRDTVIAQDVEPAPGFGGVEDYEKAVLGGELEDAVDAREIVLVRCGKVVIGRRAVGEQSRERGNTVEGHAIVAAAGIRGTEEIDPDRVEAVCATIAQKELRFGFAQIADHRLRRVASDEKRDAVLVDEVAAGGTDFHRIRGVRAERSRHYQRAQ